MDTPTPSPTDAVRLAQLAPEQWQFVAVAIILVVFAVGALLVIKL